MVVALSNNNLLRYFCTARPGLSLPKSFDEIPGPTGLLGFGNLFNYLPVVGKYAWHELHKAGHDKYQNYGEIVREKMLPGTHIVWLYNPNDIAKVLNEPDYPQRRSHLALEKYRKDRPQVYKTAGLLPTNGAEWWRLRSELQRELSAPKSVREFLPVVDQVTKEFLNCLPVDKSFDVLPYLARLNLELTGLLTFGQRFNSFSNEEMVSNSMSSLLVQAAEDTNSSILPTDQGLQLWRIIDTPTYKRLSKSQQYMEDVAIKFVRQKLDCLKENNNQTICKHSCLIEKYLLSSNLDVSDVIGAAADLLLAGIDTTSYTMAFAVYHIASGQPVVQEKLYAEAKAIFSGATTTLSADNFRQDIPYARAVLKEVFRLNPISVGVGRILNRNIVLSGYTVPKGTVVVTQNMIACRLDKYFHEPLRFNPERWMHRNNTINPYLVLPFGHGMRACIARRVAEQNILVLLLRLSMAFEITWTGSSDCLLDVHTLLINKPAEPVMIQLKARR